MMVSNKKNDYFIRVFLVFSILVPCLAYGSSAVGSGGGKAPVEGVKEFLLGPPLTTSSAKKELPFRVRKNGDQNGGGDRGKFAPVNVTKSGAVAPVQNLPTAPKEMTIAPVPLPPDKIRSVEKNLPERFYPHPPRTLPTRKGEVSPAQAALKKKKRRPDSAAPN